MFGGKRRQLQAAELYSKIVTQARAPIFYTEWAVPDTVEGRFELVILHFLLVMRRLNALGSITEKFGQELFEYMFSDLDRSIREIGVGDVSVGKYMKRFGKAFYGRAAKYDEALDKGDDMALIEAIKRNVLETAELETEDLQAPAEKLAAYIKYMNNVLSQTSYEYLISKEFSFDAPRKEAA